MMMTLILCCARGLQKITTRFCCFPPVTSGAGLMRPLAMCPLWGSSRFQSKAWSASKSVQFQSWHWSRPKLTDSRIEFTWEATQIFCLTRDLGISYTQMKGTYFELKNLDLVIGILKRKDWTGKEVGQGHMLNRKYGNVEFIKYIYKTFQGSFSLWQFFFNSRNEISFPLADEKYIRNKWADKIPLTQIEMEAPVPILNLNDRHSAMMACSFQTMSSSQQGQMQLYSYIHIILILALLLLQL